MSLGVGVGSKGRSTSASSIATGSVTTQVSGSAFVITLAWGITTFTSLVDSKGNNYVQVGPDLDLNGGGEHGRMYVCEGGVGGTGHTATLTVGAAVEISIAFQEVTASVGRALIDLGNGVIDTATPFNSPTIATQVAAEMLVAGHFGNSGSNPATHAESTGFTVQTSTEETNGTTFWTGCMATRSVSSTGSYNSSFTETGTTRAADFIVGIREVTFTAYPSYAVGRFDLAQQADWKPRSWDFALDSPDFAFDDFPPPATGGPKNIAVGLVTSTNTAFAITKKKAKAVGLVTSSSTVFAVAHRKSRTLGLCTSASTSFSIAKRKQKTLGLVTSTNVALACTRRKSKTLGLVTSASTAFALAVRRKSKTLGLLTSTNIALPVTKAGSKNIAVGLVTSTSTVFSIAHRKSKAIGLVTSTNVALSVTPTGPAPGGGGGFNWLPAFIRRRLLD